MSTATQTLNSDRLYRVIHIRKADEPRVRRPIEPTLDPRIRICLERAELVTESYRKTEGEPWILRRAKGLDHLLRNMTIYIVEGEEIVGNYASNPHSLPTHPEFSYRWLEKGLEDDFGHALDEEGKRRLKEINSYWEEHSVESRFLEAVPDELKPYMDWTGAVGTAWRWPLGCVVLNYEGSFEEGLDGLLAEVRARRAALDARDPEYRERKDFYDAAEICGEALEAFARRFARLAAVIAAGAEGERKERYLRIAETCSHVPDSPPRTFHEALQCFWFYHLVTSQIDWNSVGLGQRFDQLFRPYYEGDKAEGRITYDRAVELFEHLWIKLDDLGQINPMEHSILQVGGTKFQSATLGGTDRYGSDASNELSFAMLDATMNIRTLQPSLSLRYHEDIDPRLVDRVIDCIASGMGMPAVFNDKAVIPWTLYTALEHLFPESGKVFGVPFLPLLQRVHGAAKGALSRLPDAWEDRIEDMLRNWPYKACTGGGRAGDAVRAFTRRIGLFDADEIMYLARNWSNTACVGPGMTGMVSIQGTLTTIITTAILNYAKLLEYVLYQGVEPTTGEQLGARTPDPRTFHTYEEFQDAFLQQLKYTLEKAAAVYEISEKLYQRMMPRPLASLLVGRKTAIERGRDVCHRGDLGYSEVFLAGCVNSADSLAAIKKLVFEEKTVNMDDLVRACANDWAGQEDLRRKCLAAPKFGNDDDHVDLLLRDLYRKAVKVFKGVRDHFDRPLIPEATMAGGYYAMGLSTGATPDGRRAGETLSDGQLSPMHGRDTRGPTAVLKSCSKVDPIRCGNQLVNQKFLPSALTGDKKALFADYLRTWSEFGNWHVQFNCIDADTLREAREHPERHAGLIVRVAGYSAFYTQLNPEIQADIIRRTEQELGRPACC